jgi:hypothetical protein
MFNGVLMHHKILFTLAGIFLAVALIFPPVLLKITNDNDLDNYIKNYNDPTHSTAGNVTIIDQINENETNAYIVGLTVEVVFVALFVATLYMGINHYHGQYDKNKVEEEPAAT